MKEKFDVRMKTHLSERSFYEEKWQNHASNFHTSFLGHKLQQSNIKNVKIHFFFFVFISFIAMTLSLLVLKKERLHRKHKI